MTDWFKETLHAEISQNLRIDRVLFRDQTRFQDLIIFENARFGRVLALDGAVQTTTTDEFTYHEMLSHVPILAHGNARQVLIIGGGDGGVLRRCLYHASVERVTMVEIDRGVVDLCLAHLPEISAGAFDDPRADLIIADGAKFVAETERRFDVIIVDSTDPIGPGAVLFTQRFYADCKRCLNPDGVIVTQNGVPMLQPQETRDTYSRLSTLFADVGFYTVTVPTYIGGQLALGWGTDVESLRQADVATIRERFERAKLTTRYYTPAVHVGAFALPQYVLNLLA